MTIFQKLKLRTDHQNIRHLEFISTLDIFREIYINGAEIGDIRGLDGCDKLKIIELRGNNITDISALADKMYLKVVDLSGNRISNMEVLESCIRLQ